LEVPFEENAMKGVILAGGHGARLMPLTKVTNKHLLPVGKKPMILHPLDKMVEAGITEIMIITGPDHCGAFMMLLGSGSEYGCELAYRVQDEAGGIAQALGLCENFVNYDKFCVILGDNVFSDSLEPFAKEYESSSLRNAMVMAKQVDDASRYGVIEFDDDKKAIAIEEKPENPKSDWAQTGIYFYPPDVFSVVKTLKPSHRGELEITDVNNEFLRKDRLLVGFFDGTWTDSGTHESLRRANQFAHEAGQ
jgi:glucose-1-phosphate thymidylyltransferase